MQLLKSVSLHENQRLKGFDAVVNCMIQSLLRLRVIKLGKEITAISFNIPGYALSALLLSAYRCAIPRWALPKSACLLLANHLARIFVQLHPNPLTDMPINLILKLVYHSLRQILSTVHFPPHYFFLTREFHDNNTNSNECDPQRNQHLQGAPQ